MRFGIPLLCNRVSPRCTIADSVLLVTSNRGLILGCDRIQVAGNAWIDLLKLIKDNQIDVLVCGGIKAENREAVAALDVSIIDNVACTAEQAIEAIQKDALKSGYGFADALKEEKTYTGTLYRKGRKTLLGDPSSEAQCTQEPSQFDCLRCDEKACRRGDPCPVLDRSILVEPSAEVNQLLDTSMDIAFEEERRLCRLAELVYFCLGMGYQRLGVAYCVDLEEAADILTGLLRRFFQVVPVCCKVGGLRVNDTAMDLGNPTNEEPAKAIACNPLGQAAILNDAGTDFNVLVGLCIGVDSVFSKASEAPVTMIFVKDKSLANNPIGAIYSEHYLREIAGPQVKVHQNVV
jgi:uncharacterized metal-binding protein